MNISEVLALADTLPPWVKITVGVLLLVVLIRLVAAAVGAIATAVTGRARRSDDTKTTRPGFNWKLEIGFAGVQVAMTYGIVLGVYEFLFHVFGLEKTGAWVLALVLEAAQWTAVGFIIDHGRRTTATSRADGTVERKPSAGWGIGGPFYWIFVTIGGVFAVLGADSVKEGAGRAGVVVIGTALWVMRLLRATQPGRPRTRWSPWRTLIELGWVPDPDEDEKVVNERWKVIRLARAMRWSNGRWLKGRKTLFAVLGQRAVTRLAEEVTPDILRQAQDRCAAAYVLREHTNYQSAVMGKIIEAHAAGMVQLAELNQQQQVDEVASRSRPSPRQRPGSDEKPTVSALVDGADEVRDNNVQPIAGQLDKDRAGAVAIYRLVVQLTGRSQYATWDEIRDEIRDKKLLNSIERASKDTEVSMGKPRIVRILERADTLVALPLAEELAQARSA